MSDFDSVRRAMVDSQLRTSGVLDLRLLAAVLRVPREYFVPASRRAVAYIDGFQPLRDGDNTRFMASPAIFARLVQLAEVQPNDTVLDIGAGTGYSTAVLAMMAGSVVGVEPDADLAALANKNLSMLELGNALVVEGAPEAVGDRKFDVIYVGWSLSEVPASLLKLLNPGGRLVAAVEQGGVGIAHVYVRGEAGVTARAEFNATLPARPASKTIQEFVF